MVREQLSQTATGGLSNIERFANWLISVYPEPAIEFIILAEERDRLTNNSPGKYATLATGLRITSTFNPLARLVSWKFPEGIFPAFEPAYYVGRVVDDIADGDRELPEGYEGFQDWINHLKHCLETNFQAVPKDFSFEFLFKRAIQRLEPLQRPGDNVREEYLKFLDAMVMENQRRVNAEVKTEQQLAEINWESFSHVQDIAFIAVKSSVRITQKSGLAKLPDLLGRGYAIRDLQAELGKNICNIPKEVLDKSGLSFQQLSQNPQLVDGNSVLQSWINSEIQECRKIIEELNQVKLDIPAKFLVKILTKGIEKDLNKL